MDMTAGIAEYGRLAHRPELVAWAKRVYDWIGRTHTTRYGWVADVAGGKICEACAIASRIRLGLALYRAQAAEPFGEIDRFLRNQLMEDQFVDLSFLAPLKPETPRTDRATYDGIDRMVRGTFQCWGTANDLIGHDDIEGCGAGGGVQGMALAWANQFEWRDTAQGKELRVHLLFNRSIRAAPASGLTNAAPIAAELWSDLPYAGRVRFRAHQPIDRLALRLPDGTDLGAIKVTGSAEYHPQIDGQYARLSKIGAGDSVQIAFPLKEYETIEHAAGAEYHVRWKGSSVMSLSPPGTKVPLYSDRPKLEHAAVPLSSARYPL
jgi:hypothetical protein